MRYTVGYCLYPHGQNDAIETRMRIIFDDGLPATELNRHLVMAQFNRDKTLGTTVYQLCIYLNYLDMHGLEVVDATMDMIYDFLCELYVDGLPYGCNNEPKSYNTICDYVETLSKLYDTLALRGYHLDSSLYTQTQRMLLLPDPNTKRRKGRVVKKDEHLTNIERLQKVNDQILKKHGNPTVLQQNLKDIQTFSIYLEKMNASEDNQRRSNVV